MFVFCGLRLLIWLFCFVLVGCLFGFVVVRFVLVIFGFEVLLLEFGGFICGFCGLFVCCWFVCVICGAYLLWLFCFVFVCLSVVLICVDGLGVFALCLTYCGLLVCFCCLGVLRFCVFVVSLVCVCYFVCFGFDVVLFVDCGTVRCVF